jgi:hypothetical protein
MFERKLPRVRLDDGSLGIPVEALDHLAADDG